MAPWRVAIDFDTLRKSRWRASTDGRRGSTGKHPAVRVLPQVPEAGTVEVHLATEFQNILLDGGAFPDDLKQEMYAYCRDKLKDEWGEKDTEEQFIYKTRKKLWGPFKQQVWTIDEGTRKTLRGQLEEKFEFLFEQLGAIDSDKLVSKHIAQPARISKPPSPRPRKHCARGLAHADRHIVVARRS